MTAPSTTSGVPPLEAGQRLTREEFERRYDAMPGLKGAELIEGVVYMPSPVRFTHHCNPQGDIVTWLGLYRASTPGVLGGGEATVRLEGDNDPQPDAVLFIDPACGGKARLSADDYIEKSPELLVEVSASSEDMDMGPKRALYLRNKVREYLVWRVLAGAVDWHIRRRNRYELLTPDAAGVLRSETFPGLWLDAAALLRLDLPAVLQTLQQGLASPEHAAFVAQLRAARGAP
jgi:Uma2 family endonuclease